MKEIYCNNVHSKEVRCELNPLYELILGTNDFKNNITIKYFNSYINKGACSMKQYSGFHSFECDSEKFTLNDINIFPTIYLVNLGANHIFDLKSSELFINKENKWYFEIVFPEEDLEVERWILTRKYPIIFSPFSRLIIFYIQPNEGKTDKDSEKEKEEEKVIEQINNNKDTNKIIFLLL